MVRVMEDLLREYVDRNQGVCCSQWDPKVSEELLFDPYTENPKLVAHYFLLNASITETDLIGRAENARALMIKLQSTLGEELFTRTHPMFFNEVVSKSAFLKDLGPGYKRIGSVLAGVNKWVQDVPKGDLIGYSSGFNAEGFAAELQGIPRMGGRYAEKVWMYLRWLTRSAPDLDVYEFDARELKVPLTSLVTRVGACLGLCETPGAEAWLDPGYRDEVRDRVTGYALKMFPEDPLSVDYPFYMLGRWIEGREPSEDELRSYLEFFDELYRVTGTTASTYDIVSREKSGFERNLRGLLEKHKMMFYFEAQRFNLGDGLTYRPDFILPKIYVEGRQVILEPHGFWTGDHVEQVTTKYRKFREMFGSLYYFILIVQSKEYYRVRDGYPDSYDDIIESHRMGDLLYMLKSDGYRKIF